MQFSSILSVLALVGGALSQTSGSGTAKYDRVYDDPETSTLVLACSDGVNGLYTKGFSKLGALPKFPLVASTETVGGWNSDKCGKCYTVTWGANSIAVIAVDHAASGFVLSLAALNALTGGQGEQLGSVNVSWEEAAQSACGL